MRDRSFRYARQAHQPIAAAHDRGHDGAPVQGESAEGLRSPCAKVRRLPRAVAGWRDERGRSPLPTAYGGAADRRSNHQLRHRGSAVLLQCDAGAARPRPPSDNGAQTAQGAGRAEPGRGRPIVRSRARPEVQGRVRRRLRRGLARIRGGGVEGHRHRQPAHDLARRTGQGAAGSLCDALAATAEMAAPMVERRRGRRLGCFQGRTRSTQ